LLFKIFKALTVRLEWNCWRKASISARSFNDEITLHCRTRKAAQLNGVEDAATTRPPNPTVASCELVL